MTRHRSGPTLVAVGIMLLASPAIAQCRPPASSHEARLLAFYEAPIMFSMAAAPERLAFGAVRIGGEAGPVSLVSGSRWRSRRSVHGVSVGIATARLA